jgi:DNA-binding NarL/FixJ family response regulator
VVYAGLAHGLARHLRGTTVAVAERSVGAVLDRAMRTVDLVLLDIQLRDGSDAADNVGRLTAQGWPVLLFTQERRHHAVARALRAGASGVLSKDEELEVIASAVRSVLSGEPYLSSGWAEALAGDLPQGAPELTLRENQAVRLYAAGMKLTSVARRLHVSEDTARTYLSRARAKYANAGRPAPTKTDLYIRAVEDGLLPLPGASCRPPSPA